MPDITILSWITAEVDQALDRVRTELASYSAPPHDAAALARCPEHLHQVSGALNMVGLSGATRFCAALENSFARLDASTAANAVLVDNAVLELKQFVDDLANGQPDVAMRLYPAYRDLALVQGRVDCSEVELFFPDLTPAAPAHPSPKSLEKEELASFLQAQRTRWQRGILAWLRRQPNGLEEMRDALAEIHSAAHALPERRALWWVAGGVVDALLDVTEPGELAQARRLWNKIDLYTRDLATGAATDNEALLRELLYVLAGCAPLTQRIRDIKLLYGLDSLSPVAQPAGEAAAPDPDTLQTLVAEVREKLRKLKKFWRQYMIGEPKGRVAFGERARTLRSKAAPLQSDHLDRLLATIAEVADTLPDLHPADSDSLLIEMAAAFLLADSILDTLGRGPSDLDQQLELLSGWLRAAASGKPSASPPAGLRPEFLQEISAIQLRAQVAREIVTNLQQVEQVLDAYARGQSSDKIVQALVPQLRGDAAHGAGGGVGRLSSRGDSLFPLNRRARFSRSCGTRFQSCSTVESGTSI